MNTRPLRCWMPALLTGAMLTFWLPCRADDLHDEPGQSQSAASQLPAPPPSLLQVTGTANRFDISASHADVRSVLSAIFSQAHRQFTPDNSVSGEVTLALTGQTFDVVLASVCKQTFLRYDIDRNNIYQFQRDDQALRESFARIRLLNAAIMDQLRRLGITVPAQPQANANSPGNQDTVGRGSPAGRGFGGGGFGGGGFGGTAGSLNGAIHTQEQQPAGTTGLQLDATASRGADHSLSAKDANASAFANRSKTGNQAAPGASGDRGPQGPGGPVQNGVARSLSQEPLAPYDQLLHDNGLVGIHATRDQPVPIPEVLQRFSRQSGVQILIDPALDREHMLRFFGSIVRPLPDALNVLMPLAHLEWRYVGNTVFVTEAPDFGIFYGVSNVPRALYPSGAPKAQQGANSPTDTQRPSKQPANQDGH